METSITFLMVAITLVFQVLALGKAKIFHIFAVAGYLGLITAFTDQIAFVIMFIGLILFNLWALYDGWANS